MNEIGANTRLLAVIGDPIRHSLSPLIQNRFIKEAGLDLAYLAFPVKAGQAAEFLQSARRLEIVGFNATMPLKEELFPLMSELDPSAVGSVNTVVNKPGGFFGASTDGTGFLRALKLSGREASGLKALVLGSGGAARTVISALIQAGAEVSVCARNTKKALELVPEERLFPFPEIGSACREADLIVNATPLGMEGFGGDFESFDFIKLLPKYALVFDLIYAPRKTQLLEYAQSAGLEYANGLSHLVNQAAISFEFFTGYLPGAELVREVTGLAGETDS